MNESAADAAAAEMITGYGFRRAYEADAFDQFPLITPSKLSDEARDRGIQRASSFLEELERLDREGAFRPVLFEVEDGEGANAVIFRTEPAPRSRHPRRDLSRRRIERQVRLSTSQSKQPLNVPLGRDEQGEVRTV